MAGLRQDFTYTLRRLLASPGFVLAVVLSIGIGIAANATIFSIVSRFVLSPAPVSGRVWTLGKLCFTPVNGLAPPLTIVVEGALCAALEREFREVVTGLGGKPFRRLGVSAWVPAVVGATGIEPNALVARLGWGIPTSLPAEPRLQPLGIETSDLVAEHHVLASSWD